MKNDFIQEYTAQTPDLIWQEVEKTQAGTRVRRLSKQEIDEIIGEVETHPWGYIITHGGAVSKSYKYSAEATYLSVAWYTWRHKKWIHFSASRDNARKISYGPGSESKKDFNKKRHGG